MSLYLPRLEHGELKRTTTTFGLPLGHLAPVAPVHVASEFNVSVSFFQGSGLGEKSMICLNFLYCGSTLTARYSTHIAVFSLFCCPKMQLSRNHFTRLLLFLKEALASEDATLPGLGPCLFLRLTVARKRIANAAPSSLFRIAGPQFISSNCTTRATPSRASVVERSAGSTQTPSRTRETRFRTGPRSS